MTRLVNAFEKVGAINTYSSQLLPSQLDDDLVRTAF